MGRQVYNSSKKKSKHTLQLIVRTILFVLILSLFYFLYRTYFNYTTKEYLYAYSTVYFALTIIALVSLGCLIFAIPANIKKIRKHKKVTVLISLYLAGVLVMPLLFGKTGTQIDENNIYQKGVFTETKYSMDQICNIDMLVHEVNGYFYYDIYLKNNKVITLSNFEYIFPPFKSSHALIEFHKKVIPYINQKSIDKQDYQALARRFFDNDDDYNYMKNYLKQASQGNASE